MTHNEYTDVQAAYNAWASQYDTNENKTRDLEGQSLIETLSPFTFEDCLEIGCGTGKNTAWLVTKARHVTAIDLSGKMLDVARSKINSDKVTFHQADITKPWTFTDQQFDLVTFSLILEHIEDLGDIFQKLSSIVKDDGLVYIGELHPFKQYTGSKARFETSEGVKVVTCFNHHLSDFTSAATQSGFKVELLSEYFDQNDRTLVPRILTMLLRRRWSIVHSR